MIRQASANDIPAILELSQQVGFGEDEKAFFKETLEQAIESESGKYTIVYGEDRISGAAYLSEEDLAPGVWNMLFIAVDDSSRNSGIGTKLVKHIEEKLKRWGARILLVETSNQDYFKPSRKFYTKNNFELEATIRDYYEPGDDKLIYYKKL